MITEENIQLLNLLDASIHGSCRNEIKIDDWVSARNELAMQAVDILPAAVMRELGLQNDARLPYIASVARNVQIFHHILGEQKALFSLFDDNGISCAVLKGAAAAMSYPKPEYRRMGDIDVIVPKDQFAQAYQLMCDSGYRAEISMEEMERHAGFRTKTGTEIELHAYFSSSTDKRQNQILDEYVYQGIDKRITTDISGYSVYVLPPLENGLVLLGHINQHLGTGLGLRQIIDWMCYVEKYLDDETWNKSFSNAAEQIGMKRLAEVTTFLCKKYLGLKDTITWCDCVEGDSITEELMEYIFSHGNFGRKDSAGSKTVSVVRSFANPIKGFVTLQKTGMHTWELYKKHRWLKPFCWIYQLFRWINHGIRNGVTLSSFSQNTKKEKTETEFLKRLGITRL